MAKSDKVCGIITIGEKDVHYPWRICTNCRGNVENVPDNCPHCGARVVTFEDRYIRRKTIVLD